MSPQRPERVHAPLRDVILIVPNPHGHISLIRRPDERRGVNVQLLVRARGWDATGYLLKESRG
eukprot:10895071-Alexandrium_andersonii.AAC.1